MAFNLIPCDRDQPFLMPPSLSGWLPEGHLARFICQVVDQLDLKRSTGDDGRMGAAGRPMTRR